MTHNAATDHGTVLEADQAALVVDADGSFRLLLPDMPEHSAAARGVVLIAAIAVKMADPAWIEEMLEVFAQAHKALN